MVCDPVYSLSKMASAEKLALRGHRAYKAQQDLKVIKGKKETPLRMKILRKNSYLI